MNGPTLKSTPLNAVHREFGARMVEFGGWDMPLHYGSQIEEHHAVRRACGMFDVSHMLAIDVDGADSAAFLQYVLANDVARLQAPGRALYTCMLNPAGGVVDDLIVYFLADDRYRLVVNAGTAVKDHAWLVQQRDAGACRRVDIKPRHDLAMIAVQGPQAADKLGAALPDAARIAQSLDYFTAVATAEHMIARTGYTGEDGFELSVPAARAVELWRRLHALGVVPAGLAARDTLRLEAGMNLYGQDMDETTTPLETGLMWTVDRKTPRDFIGRSALDRANPQRRAAGLLLIDKGVMRAHQRVVTAHGEGEITSGGFGPTLERSIALARLPAAAQPGDRVTVEIRGKLLAARVVKPPFVRKGKVLIDCGA